MPIVTYIYGSFMRRKDLFEKLLEHNNRNICVLNSYEDSWITTVQRLCIDNDSYTHIIIDSHLQPDDINIHMDNIFNVDDQLMFDDAHLLMEEITHY